MSTLLDLEMDLLRASEAVLALEDRLQAGEVVDEAEYDLALQPFREQLAMTKAKRDRFAEFILFLGKQSELHGERLMLDTKRKRAIDHLIVKLKAIAAFAIYCTDSNKLEGEVRTMQVYKNSSDTLTIKDESRIPAECYDLVPTLNKDRLREAIKAGNIPSDVAELTRGEHLRIK